MTSYLMSYLTSYLTSSLCKGFGIVTSIRKLHCNFSWSENKVHTVSHCRAMPRACTFCNSKTGNFRFPKNEERRTIWRLAIPRQKHPGTQWYGYLWKALAWYVWASTCEWRVNIGLVMMIRHQFLMFQNQCSRQRLLHLGKHPTRPDNWLCKTR